MLTNNITTTFKDKHRIIEIDYLRAIGILAVVLGHSILVYPINLYEINWCRWLADILYSFHVELLFFVAGFCYTCSNYLDFLIKKTKRILIPYFSFGILILLLRSFGSSFVNPARISTLTDSFVSLLLNGGAYWFLYVLFLIFAIYPLLEKICKHVMVQIIVCVLLSFCLTWPDIFSMSRVIYFMIFFIFGKLAEKLFRQKNLFSAPAKIHFKLLAISLIFLVIVYVGIFYRGLVESLKLLRSVGFIMLIMETVLVIPWFRTPVNTHIKKLLTDCSSFSLQLYLFNGLLLGILRLLFCRILHISNAFILISGIWILDVLLTILICRYILPKSTILSFCCGLPHKRT